MNGIRWSVLQKIQTFFQCFAKRRKTVEKMAHRGRRTSKIGKSTQSYSNGHLHFTTYCARSIHDVECKFRAQ